MRTPTRVHSIEHLERRLHLDGTTPTLTYSTAQLSLARVGILAASAGNEALFAGGGVSAVASTDVVDIYDYDTGRWTATTLPPQTGGAAVGVGNDVYFLSGSDLQSLAVYNTETGQWSTVPGVPNTSALLNVAGSFDSLGFFKSQKGVLQKGDAVRANLSLQGEIAVSGTRIIFGAHPYSSAPYDSYDVLSAQLTELAPGLPTGEMGVPIGAKLLVANVNRAAGDTTPDYLIDTITGRAREVAAPTTFTIAPETTYTIVGTKAIFSDAGGTGGTYGVYDLSTGTWSNVGPGGRPDCTTVGDKAIFAGTYDLDFNVSAGVDVLADTAPLSVLDGGVAGRRRNKAVVVLQNSGDADLTGPYTVQIYAIPPGQYHNAILVGSQAMNSNLAAGDSLRFSIPISLASAPAGTYHLVAMVKAADGTLTPFAGATQNFTIGQSASATPAVKRTAQIRPSLNAAPAAQSDAPDTWLSSADEVLW